MTEEQFHQYQEQIFDSFCMTLIDNASKAIHKQLTAQAKREKSLSTLTQDEMAEIAVHDAYELDLHTFSVNGEVITIHNPTLAAALRRISPKLRDVILLFYFLEKSEPQIGQILSMGKSGVHKRRKKSLDQLREIMESLDDE